MRIVEQRVSNNAVEIFELEEFLSRPLFAHLATSSEDGPRESPVWFHWDGKYVWVIGGTSFPQSIIREPRCAIGIVDFRPSTGLVHHVGMRGSAVVLPFDKSIVCAVYRKYLGSDQEKWDKRFESSWTGEEEMRLVRFSPEVVVIRDQSYFP